MSILCPHPIQIRFIGARTEREMLYQTWVSDYWENIWVTFPTRAQATAFHYEVDPNFYEPWADILLPDTLLLGEQR